MKNDVSKRKKTSKEKRALIGALCIAAAVAAGSTFAWFSSVDEVTNRLSANAAYDVSIIETFTPPTNWIPGQKVNKDTAAVNTGNIPAFVKQKLEGKMRVTMEEAVDTFAPSPDKTYIELTEDELDSIEAGGFLAWASDGPEESKRIGYEKGKGTVADAEHCYLGEVSAVHSGANFDDMKPKSDYYSKIQFAPPATGDYIFRRVIDVAGDGTETYEYAGYHYDDQTGKYYKIKVINELQPGEDGILKVAPKVYYGVEKEDIQILPLRYEEAGTEKYIKYKDKDTGETIKAEYTEKELADGRLGSKFLIYKYGSKNYCVVTDPGTDTLTKGDIYTFANPLGTKIGQVVGDVDTLKYEEDKSTPQRLVATYPVGKSDDVFIGESTDMSDPTADSYDTNLRDIAYSDYLVAKVAYDNAKAKYDLDKAAYDAAVALLTALKDNEEKLNKLNEAIVGLGTFNGEINQPDFTCTDTSVENYAIKNEAASDTYFANQISQMNTAFGSYVDVGDPAKKQNQYVSEFLDAVNVYKGEPTDENWRNVSNKYQEVTNHFTAVNSKVSAFEAAIVQKWEAAGLNSNITGTFKDIAALDLTGNASNAAITIKYAADQLKAWETKLATYQTEVNNYFKKISDIQSDSKYTLQDLRPLNAAYTKAVGDDAKKYKTDAPHDTNEDQSGRASKIEEVQNEKIQVSTDYYITVNSNPRNALELNDSKEPPIKNTISNNGYAGTAAIPYITGSQPFKIGNKAIAEVTPPDYNTVTDLEGKYIAAQDQYNKFNTKHTNQDTNNDIVIYINLANVCKDGTVNKNEWKLSPTLVAGDKEANFYYTSILGAGEQTSILVDSLELSGDTTNVAFKDFDFDLNVTVDSSQVVVSEDGNYYESTAVMANDAFKVKPSKVKYDKEEAKPVKDYVKVDWT